MLFDDYHLSAYHQYLVFATGIDGFKEKYFNTRKDAECYMHKVCMKYGINVECTECDKHTRKYSNHCGVRFYINRV